MNNQKEQVLFIISSLGAGGAEKVCITLLNYLCTEYQCDMVVISGNSIAYDIDKRINVYFLDEKGKNSNIIRKLFTIVRNRRRINKFIADQEKDAGPYKLITAHLNMAYILSLILKKRNDIMYVFHNPQSHNKLSKSKLYKKVFRKLFNNKIIGSVSEGVKNELIYEYGMDAEKIQVIWNPINIQEIKEASMQIFQPKRKYFVGIGRLTAEKNFSRLIDVFFQGMFYIEYDLVICGEGELRGKLENKIDSLNMNEYIHLVGFQKNPYVWMKNADLMILTSNYEALPMCIIEGLSVGTKIVAANCNYGPNELMTGEFSDFLVEPVDDISQYIICINKALKEYPKILSSYIERFSTGEICQRYFEVYNELRIK